MRRGARAFALAALAAVAACGGAPDRTRAALPPTNDRAFSLQAGSKIAHVIVIVQENRSFDNYFHGFPGADYATHGFNHKGNVVPLLPTTAVNPGNPAHSHLQFLLDYAGGTNDGFDRQIAGIRGLIGKPCPAPPAPRDGRNDPACWELLESPAIYSYVPRSQIEPYWTMARRFALADRAFGSNNGPSYPAHQFLIAGQAAHVTEIPFGGDEFVWGCGNPKAVTIQLRYGSTTPPHFPKTAGLEEVGPTPCFRYATAATLLDRAKIAWRYYAPPVGNDSYGGVWSAFDAIATVRRGPDWGNVRSPETRILTDIAHGDLAPVSWVVPNLTNSDHPNWTNLVGPGPDWVASIVNAVGTSPYWNDTAVVILWDEWGGLYDHVVPPQYADPVTGAYEGLGFRIPLLVVSPYAKRGYVSHVQHETASTLHFIEDVFHLGTLGLADARADDLGDMFDFTQKPVPFEPVPTLRGARYFLSLPPNRQPPDDD